MSWGHVPKFSYAYLNRDPPEPIREGNEAAVLEQCDPVSNSQPRISTSTQSSSKLSFFHGLYQRIKKQNQSARCNQYVTDLFECVDQIEEEARICRSKEHAEQLFDKLKEKDKHIQCLLRRLQNIIDQESDVTGQHKENPQHLKLTSSTSEILAVQLTEKDDEIRVLKEQCDKRTQQIRLLEGEKIGHCEQAKQFEIDYHVEVQENEVLRAENETLKHQLDSGLVVCLDGEGDDNAGEIDDFKRVVSSLKARVNELNEDVNKLRDHSKEQSRQILKYKQQVEVSTLMEGQLESMERMYLELKEECNQMHKQLLDARQQLQAKEELQSEMAALKTQLAVYQTDFDEERRDRVEAHSRMAELEKKGAHVEGQTELEREAYHREHNDLKHNYQIITSQLEQHQQALSAVEEVNEILRQEIQAKSSQVKQYAKEVDRLKRELEESRSRVSERTSTHSDASGMKYLKLEDLYQTAQDDIQYLSEENSRHQDRIGMLERENVQLKNLLESQRISAASQASTPLGHKIAVEMSPTEQPLQMAPAVETHRKEPCAHPRPRVSPLTGEKQSQRAPQAGHITVDFVELDGPNPHSKEPVHSPKYPAGQLRSPEQESVTPKQIRPDQQEKVLAPTHPDYHALQPHNMGSDVLHSQPALPQSQVQATLQPHSTESASDSKSHRGESSPDQAPRQNTEHHTKEHDNRQLEDSTAQYENPLQKELDDEIHQQAADVIQEVSGGKQRVKTDLQRPFDPNLVCPMCRRQFRIGEIQKFRRHVNTCAGTDAD